MVAVQWWYGGVFLQPEWENYILLTASWTLISILIILKENLHESADNLGIRNSFTFYQDNDPKHKALISQTWLIYNCPHVMETPPQSPDINPIENLWGELEKRIRKFQISNKNDLKAHLQRKWSLIPPSFTEKLVQSMPNRLREVIHNKGYPTRY